VQSSPLTTQIAVLTGIAILMTVGVYGLVAGIVKIDDLGLRLTRKVGDSLRARYKRSIGRGILWFAPYMMKGLSIVGTAAMFLVGGGILTHGFPVIHHWVEGFTSGRNSLLTSIISLGTDAVTGIVAGAAVLAVVTVFNRVNKRIRK
jgi:uncharacterized protein